MCALKIVSRDKILRFKNTFIIIIIFVVVDLCFSWLFVAKELLLLVFTLGVGVVCCSGMIPCEFLQGCGLHLLLIHWTCTGVGKWLHTPPSHPTLAELQGLS